MRQALVAWLGLVVIAVMASANCSVSHKSDGFACGSGMPACTDGRFCDNGFCVTMMDDAGVTKLDGNGSGSGHPDAPGCPDACTSCDLDLHTCLIDCGQQSCANQISCPLGFHCDIECSTNNACAKGVSCTDAASCTVNCSGPGSCRGIACGTGPCDVTCTGDNSCRTVGCGQSCRCDVTCAFNSSCEGVVCKTGCKDVLDNGCSSANGQQCDTCP